MHVKNDLMYGISEEKENDVESERENYFNFNMRREIYVNSFERWKRIISRNWGKNKIVYIESKKLKKKKIINVGLFELKKPENMKTRIHVFFFNPCYPVAY